MARLFQFYLCISLALVFNDTCGQGSNEYNRASNTLDQLNRVNPGSNIFSLPNRMDLVTDYYYFEQFLPGKLFQKGLGYQVDSMEYNLKTNTFIIKNNKRWIIHSTLIDSAKVKRDGDSITLISSHLYEQGPHVSPTVYEKLYFNDSLEVLKLTTLKFIEQSSHPMISLAPQPPQEIQERRIFIRSAGCFTELRNFSRKALKNFGDWNKNIKNYIRVNNLKHSNDNHIKAVFMHLNELNGNKKNAASD